jgi:hypothetical protein
VQPVSLKSLTVRKWSLGAPRDIFQAKELFNCGTTLLFSGYTINILGGEDQNSQWCKAYSYYSSPSTQNEVIWTSGIARAACVPEVFACKEGVSWSPSTQNEVIWTSRIARAGCVPEVFDCKEVVSWCVLTFSFGLFRLPYNVFSLLPHGKLVRTINFTARRVLISSCV